MSRFQILILPVLVAAFLSPPIHADDYPEATATAKPNVVISPFPPNKKVDITGFLPGDLARDPHSNQIFRVPAKKATPLVFKPEIIEDDPVVTPPTSPGSVTIHRPQIVEGPGSVTDPTIPTPPAVVESNLPPVVAPVKPVAPARSSREIDESLTDFVKTFIRNGQNDDPMAQIQFLAPKVASYYTLVDADRDRVKAVRETQISQWPRRIYVVSGKPRFVRWISAVDAEDEFVIDLRVYQSLKNTSGNTKRGYADHRLSIHEKPDGTFEITGAEERQPRTVLAEQ